MDRRCLRWDTKVRKPWQGFDHRGAYEVDERNAANVQEARLLRNVRSHRKGEGG